MNKRLKESTKKVRFGSKTKKTVSLSGRPEDYVSAEVALRPMSREFKVLEGDEWVLSRNVRNYLASADNVGSTIKGLKDNNFQVLAVGAASISIEGNVDLVEKHCQTQLKLKTAQLFNSAISKKKVSFYGAPEDQHILNAPDN